MCVMTWRSARSAACCAGVLRAGLPCTRWAAAARLSGLAVGSGVPVVLAPVGLGLGEGELTGVRPLALWDPAAGCPPAELQLAAPTAAAQAAAAARRGQNRSVRTTVTSVARPGRCRPPG